MNPEQPISENAPDVLTPGWARAWRWGAPAATLLALLILILKSLFSPDIKYLGGGPARWIVFPLPVETRIFQGVPLVGTFRKTFILTGKPGAAGVIWRCFTNGQLVINGSAVVTPESESRNWKARTRVDISSYIHPGTNEIEAVVTNKYGPPAVNLELRAGNTLVDSDESWQVSVSGSDWRAARLAGANPGIQKGNEVYGSETPLESLRASWPWLLLFAGIAAVLAGALLYVKSLPLWPARFLLLAGAAWLALLVHNAPLIPAKAGFDALDHVAYIHYIQEFKSLPAADEGWEMNQAPLYYVTSALWLGLTGHDVMKADGLTTLLYENIFIGLGILALIFIGLRTLFAGDWLKPVAGTALAAFLPMDIYMLHYPTNETFAALFVTAVLVATLRILVAGKASWRNTVLLGVALGLALLSKSSALLCVPVALGCVSIKLAMRRERAAKVWGMEIGVPLAICFAISAWHYLRLWHQFGSPLVGGWSAEVNTPWWQEKGYQTASSFFSFRDGLLHPFYSGLRGFWDGIYSTLWGDGLWGGQTQISTRTPWNYNLMAFGYILALIPTGIFLTGLARTLSNIFRAPRLSWILLSGVAWLFALAVLTLNLKIPYYGHAKAFFSLSALLPFCAMAALGMEYWIRRGGKVRIAVLFLAFWWGMNCYASFWIEPHAARTALADAFGRMYFLNDSSPEKFLRVMRAFPNDPATPTAALSAAVEKSAKDPKTAEAWLWEAHKKYPNNGLIEMYLALTLIKRDKLHDAYAHAQRALDLEPENQPAAENLCMLALKLEDYKTAIRAGRYSLALKPADLQTHFNLGAALLNSGAAAEACGQFESVLTSQPGWPDAQYCLGLCLLQQPGRKAEAIDHLQTAVRLDPSHPDWQAVLAHAVQP